MTLPGAGDSLAEHQAEQQWGELIGTFVSDEEIGKGEAFVGIHEVLVTATNLKKAGGKSTTSASGHPPLPTELAAAVAEAIPQLLQLSPGDTAVLVDIHCPALYDKALERLSGEDDSAEKRYTYLRYLLRPDTDGTDDPSLRVFGVQ